MNHPAYEIQARESGTYLVLRGRIRIAEILLEAEHPKLRLEIAEMRQAILHEGIVPPAACVGCKQGLDVLMLDADGVLTSVSGKPGKPSHAVDDSWTLCLAQASRDELLAEIRRLVRLIPTCADCGQPIFDNGDVRCVDCAAEKPTLTSDDMAQIAEGIEHFIVGGDPRLAEIWNPFLAKLQAFDKLIGFCLNCDRARPVKRHGHRYVCVTCATYNISIAGIQTCERVGDMIAVLRASSSATTQIISTAELGNAGTRRIMHDGHLGARGGE